MAFLQTIIYTISSALLYPVMLALVLLCIWIVILTGSIFSEWISRSKTKNRNTSSYMKEIALKKLLPEKLAQKLSSTVKQFFSDISGLLSSKDKFIEQKVETLIQQTESRIYKNYFRIRMLVRIGPSLGLMGTLIPMGTGLAALSKGDMNAMTSNLIIAFTTTVVGLAIGIISYFYSNLKEAWAQSDIRDIELISEALMSGRK